MRNLIICLFLALAACDSQVDYDQVADYCDEDAAGYVECSLPDRCVAIGGNNIGQSLRSCGDDELHCCEIEEPDCDGVIDWCLDNAPESSFPIECWCPGRLCFDAALVELGSCSGPDPWE
jgi:hypothetical protein